MHELTGIKSNSAINYIQDKDGNILKNAYSATNKFNAHFCSIHKVFKDPTESPSNIHFSRLESMTQRKLKVILCAYEHILLIVRDRYISFKQQIHYMY